MLARVFRVVVLAIFFSLNIHKLAFATDYFVATTGVDSNPGTIGSPFGTIQHCALVAKAGDNCFIRAGIYRESVVPAQSGTSSSPITFQAYNAESVTITGADIISKWSPAGSNLYTSSVSTSLGTGNNQIFLDGSMINEARWPNPGSDISNPIKSTATSVEWSNVANWNTTQWATIDDTALTQPSGFWNGATIVYLAGDEWVASTATITNYTHDANGGHLTFNFTYTYYEDVPIKGNHYYLTNSLNALTTPNQWNIQAPAQGGAGTLYLMLADNPSNHTIEMKTRSWAFDLSNRNYITIRDLNIFAAGINSNNSQGLLIDTINAKYISHFTLIGSQAGWTMHVDDSGIVLNGSGSKIQNSVIAYSAGSGVSVSGTNQVVTNNMIHDVDYACTDSAGIFSYGSGHEFSHNTIYNTGRSAIVHRNTSATKIMYNDLYSYGLQTNDLGGTYTFNTDGGGSVLAYNRIHDVKDRGVYNEVGIYFDAGSRNFIVHHNIVYNVNIALQMNPQNTQTGPAGNHLIYNNTLNSRYQIIAGGGTGIPGWLTTTSPVAIDNNILNGMSPNNLIGFNYGAANTSGNPGYVDAASGNFQLAAGSAAIDTGDFLSPYTDGYLGSRPDIGALEYGSQPFAVGANITPPTSSSTNPSPAPSVSPSPSPSPVSAAKSAFTKLEAEAADVLSGPVVVPVANASGGQCLGYLDQGKYIVYRNMDFGSTGPSQFTAHIAVNTAYPGRHLELHLDSATGPLVGTLVAQPTSSDWSTFQDESTPVSGATGVHDLYIVISNGVGAGNLDYFSFSSNRSALTPIEAEAADVLSGPRILQSPNASGGAFVGYLDQGTYLQFKNIDFGSGVTQFDAHIAVNSQYPGRHLELHLDSPSGPTIGTLVAKVTGTDWLSFQDEETPVSNASGVHDLFIVISGGLGAGNLDYFSFKANSERNAFAKIEGESADYILNSKILQATNASGGAFVGYLDQGDYVMYKNVDFGTNGPSSFTAHIAVNNQYAYRNLELHLDSPTGPLIGNLVAQPTGSDWLTFQDESTAVAGASGVHDLYIVISNGVGAGNLDYFNFYP